MDMSNGNDEPQSLRSSFTSAEKLRRALANETSSTAPTYQDALVQSIESYHRSLETAREVHLWSTNETIEDVSSGDLQYFLIPYHLGVLTSKRNEAERKTVLLEARRYLEEFLKLLDSYDMLSKLDADLYERFMENRDQFAITSNQDAASRREAKIARFRTEKTLKGKLEQLQRDPMALANDDTALRELHTTNIKLSTHHTFQELESIAQEVQILNLAPPSEEDYRSRLQDDPRMRNRLEDSYSERLDRPLSELLAHSRTGPILSKDGRPLKPFTLLDSRQRLQQGVFRPDHSLPTMTIDEYLEEERRRGGIIEGGGEASLRRPEPNEDDFDKADAETVKQRAWDDFKDENPRGSGNTMNMG